MKIQQSNEWAFTMNIKEHITNDESKEYIAKLCSIIIKHLNRLIKDLDKSKKYDAEDVHFISTDLCYLKQDFSFLMDVCNGTIKEEDFQDYFFNGDYLAYFNGILDSLYDVADSRILNKKGDVSYKFLLIN